MFLFERLAQVFYSYYLLATSAGLILLGFVGSINVLIITATTPSFLGWLGLMVSVMATMRFLALFLAHYPRRRVAEAFFSGMVVELFILAFLLVN